MGIELTSDYYTIGKFDSMINFSFMASVNNALGNIASIDTVYSKYAGALNTDGAKGNVLSYISSHDTNLFFKDYSKEDYLKQKLAGTLLLMAPGAVQIFYGDESGRTSALKGKINTAGDSCTDNTQYTRSDMNWEGMNTDILSHWRKLGSFRQKHFAVGMGQHTKLYDVPYIFSRIYGEDKIICVIGAGGECSINVSTVFEENSKVVDFYTGNNYTVLNGTVKIPADKNKGVILLEKSIIN